MLARVTPLLSITRLCKGVKTVHCLALLEVGHEAVQYDQGKEQGSNHEQVRGGYYGLGETCSAAGAGSLQQEGDQAQQDSIRRHRGRDREVDGEKRQTGGSELNQKMLLKQK